MPTEFFSPNTKTSISASFNSKEGTVYLAISKKVEGISSAVGLKLSQDEVGGMIEIIRRRSKIPLKITHSFDGEEKTAEFKFYNVEEKNLVGFGLTVNKGDETWKFDFKCPVAERFMEFLRFALTHIFTNNYSEDVKRGKLAAKSKDKPAEPAQNEQEELEKDRREAIQQEKKIRQEAPHDFRASEDGDVDF